MPAASPASRIAGDRGLRREWIVQELLRQIIQGELRSGQRLVTEELAGRFGVSHTPIREALITLAGMGIIELAPNRGATIRRVTAREVREVGQVRRALECEAVRLACGRIALQDLVTLEHELQKLDAMVSHGSSVVIAQAQLLDSRLHDIIADSSGNSFLMHELHRLKILFRAFRDAAWEFDGRTNAYGRLQEEIREHLEIVQALAARDRQAAARAMSQHIRSGVIYWMKAIPRESSFGSGNSRLLSKG